ncbi:MAG: DUF3429 domain-containing protein [Pseudomonadota bacterium]
MSRVPIAAAALGAAGLLPFAFGALAAHGLMPGVNNPVTGLLVLQGYGAAILAFMGGCLWGFAAQAGRTGWREFAVSVAPGLWAFAVTFSPNAILSLIIGFVFLQILDLMFRGWGLGPEWWIRLRAPLTVAVLICLTVGAFA